MSGSKVVDEANDLISSARVEGTTVYDRAGEKLGTVSYFMVDKRSGQVAYAVLKFGGLFGLGSDHYPLPWNVLDYNTDKGGYVVDIDRARLEEAPRHAGDVPWDPAYGERVRGYWDVPHPGPFI